MKAAIHPKSTRGLVIVRSLMLFVFVLFGLMSAIAEQIPRQVAIVADLDGAIGPATVRHVSDAINMAHDRSAEVVILRINTSGGLATSMREIVTEILESPVPVVGYVAPQGGHAASAGLYILYACHMAAMAPGTNAGSATPVQIGGFPPPVPRARSEEKDTGNDSTDQNGTAPTDQDASPVSTVPPASDPMSAKVINDAVAYIRSLAQLRGRNADWAETAVREAASLSANDALDADVINLISVDLNDLLNQLDGRQITAAGIDRKLATKDLLIELIEPSFVTNMLKLLSNPNVALLLMAVGVYGLIFEFSNPGIGPGIIGAICLLLGLYAINQLPVNYTGLALMLLGIGLMVTEAVTPTFGVLGIGGIIAFSIGAAILIDTDIPEYQVSWSTIAITALLSFTVLSLLFGYVWRTLRQPVRTGAAGLLGETAEVIDWSDGVGHVWTQGERWDAVGPAFLQPGDRIQVAGLKGLKLEIRKNGAEEARNGET